MKAAITASGPSLDAALDPRFGRAAYFVLVETEDMQFEAVENPNLSLGGGAGIQSAQLMAERGVQVVLTGNCGPNAFKTLVAAGVSLVTGCSGTVAEVVERFKKGALKSAEQPNVEVHFGSASAAETAPSSDDGRGMGGGGRGMGGGGRGMGGGGRGRGGGGRGMGGGGRGMGGGGRGGR